MVTIERVQEGIVGYIDREILPQMQGWKKWTFGAAITLWVSNLPNVIQTAKDNPVISSLGVIDQNGMIDIDKLYGSIAKQADKGPITIEVPMIGAMTLNRRDVDTLYRLILGGAQ